MFICHTGHSKCDQSACAERQEGVDSCAIAEFCETSIEGRPVDPEEQAAWRTITEELIELSSQI